MEERLLKLVVQKVGLVLPYKAPNYTLPLSRRIRHRVEFELAFRADRITNNWFMVYARKNDFGYARLGLVVSKKTIQKATGRNFAKRLVREVFRCYFSSEKSLDIVVRAKRRLNCDNSDEGRLALLKIFQSLTE